jgi:hypothetical protein
MTLKSPLVPLVFLSLALGAVSGCRLLGSGKPLGGVELRKEQLDAALPARLPNVVYVADFELDTANFSGDQGVRGALPQRLQERFQGLGQALPKPLTTGDAGQAAGKIVDQMADSITRGLKAKGVPAERLGSATVALPREGWMISGVFTEVDEGNRIQRATVGLGKGATQMDVQVGISDLQGANPRAPFAIFGTVKDASKMPGGAVTLNPYVMAAKFVLEKNATSRDVQNTAKQIVDELLKFREDVRQARPAGRVPPPAP